MTATPLMSAMPLRTTLPQPLGVTYAPGGSTFAVFAEARKVRLRLTHPGTRQLIEADLAELPTEPGVFVVHLEGDWLHWSYAYEIEREGRRLGGIVDPWAVLVRDGVGYIAHDTTEVAPRPALEPIDAIIYELHVRDFTRDPACGVKPEWRGTYLGLAQSGTKLESTTLATGLDHIVELGANVVQLMPVHAFALPYNPEYEWGYMPLYYNAPSDKYAASVEIDAPIREFKRLVSALHQNGLRVTLDVVYNHTFERWPDRLRSLMALAPREYFRFKDDGTPWNGSLCGNEFRSESAQGRRLIVESCLYWVREFGIDGFRFDLMGLIDQETMTVVTRALHAVDPTILVYGEPWAAGLTPIEVNGKGKQRGRGWGVFNDDIRDGLRGEVFKPEDHGFLSSGSNAGRVKIGILGGCGTAPSAPTRVAPPVPSFADAPTETINYIECHDNHTLLDRLQMVLKLDPSVTDEDRDRMSRLGMLALMTSQGIPFLHSGQEFGRTKNGHDNTYDLGDQINNIRWSVKELRASLYAFYREAIRLRKEHPMFRLATAGEVRESVRFLDDDLHLRLPAGTIGFVVVDASGADAWERATVLLNGGRGPVVMPLPEGEWSVWTIDGRFERRKDVRTTASGSVTLGAHSGAVLYRERAG